MIKSSMLDSGNEPVSNRRKEPGSAQKNTRLHLEQDVDDEDVEDVLERDDDAVEDGFQLRDPVDGLQGPENPKQLQGFQSLARWGSAKHVGNSIRALVRT